MSNERAKLLAEIEAFLTETGMYPSHFGRDSVNDPALIGRLRQGGDIKLSTADRLRAFMLAHRKKARPPSKPPALTKKTRPR